jgi:hypothetical protein
LASRVLIEVRKHFRQLALQPGVLESGVLGSSKHEGISWDLDIKTWDFARKNGVWT